MSALQKIEQQLNSAPNLKSALTENFVENRFITNYEAVTGRKDGKTKFQSTLLSYMERVAEKPELMKADRFSHFAAIVKIGRMGLPLEKLYIMANGSNGIKVQSDPAGKRAQLEMMEEIRRVSEPQFVLKKDKFVHDKLNNVIKVHETEHMGEAFTIADIVCSYVRIEWKDKTVTDVVVYNQDLLKAKAKSPAKSDASFWATYPGEAAKKVAINRAHRLYHKYPDNVVDYGDDEKDDSDQPKDTDAQEDFIVTQAETVSEAEVVDQETGEVTQAETPTEEVKPEEKKKSAAGKQESFI